METVRIIVWVVLAAWLIGLIPTILVDALAAPGGFTYKRLANLFVSRLIQLSRTVWLLAAVGMGAYFGYVAYMSNGTDRMGLYGLVHAGGLPPIIGAVLLIVGIMVAFNIPFASVWEQEPDKAIFDRDVQLFMSWAARHSSTTGRFILTTPYPLTRSQMTRIDFYFHPSEVQFVVDHHHSRLVLQEAPASAEELTSAA